MRRLCVTHIGDARGAGGDSSRSALHSSTAFFDKLSNRLLTNNYVANPVVLLDAAALNDHGHPVVELILTVQKFWQGKPLDEMATFALPVIRPGKKIGGDALAGLLDAVNARNTKEAMLLGGRRPDHSGARRYQTVVRAIAARVTMRRQSAGRKTAISNFLIISKALPSHRANGWDFRALV